MVNVDSVINILTQLQIEKVALMTNVQNRKSYSSTEHVYSALFLRGSKQRENADLMIVDHVINWLLMEVVNCAHHFRELHEAEENVAQTIVEQMKFL